VRTAFAEAEAAVKTARGDTPRHLYAADVQAEAADRWPWALYVRPGAEALGCRGLSAHDCRHYWATRAAQMGTDPFTRRRLAAGTRWPGRGAMWPRPRSPTKACACRVGGAPAGAGRWDHSAGRHRRGRAGAWHWSPSGLMAPARHSISAGANGRRKPRTHWPRLPPTAQSPRLPVCPPRDGPLHRPYLCTCTSTCAVTHSRLG
jgi:hypothetical protein